MHQPASTSLGPNAWVSYKCKPKPSTVLFEKYASPQEGVINLMTVLKRWDHGTYSSIAYICTLSFLRRLHLVCAVRAIYHDSRRGAGGKCPENVGRYQQLVRRDHNHTIVTQTHEYRPASSFTLPITRAKQSTNTYHVSVRGILESGRWSASILITIMSSNKALRI